MNEELQVGLGLKIDKFQEGLKSATRNVDSFASKLKSPLNALMGFKSAIAGGIGLATIQQLSDYAEQLRNMSEALNITTGDLQRFYNSASFSGISMETANKSLAKFNNSLNSAANGSVESGDAFAKIGVSLRDSNGDMRNTMEVLMDVADAFSKVENKANNGRLAVEMFGKQGMKLVGFLNQGRKAIEEMGESRPILSDDAIDRLDKMGDDIKAIFDSLVANTGEWLSYLQPVTEGLKQQIFFFRRLQDAINSVAEAMTTLTAHGVSKLVGWSTEGYHTQQHIVSSVKKIAMLTLSTSSGLAAFGVLPRMAQASVLNFIKPDRSQTEQTEFDAIKAREIALKAAAKSEEELQKKRFQFEFENSSLHKKRILLEEELAKAVQLRNEHEERLRKTNDPQARRDANEQSKKMLEIQSSLLAVETQRAERKQKLDDLLNQKVAIENSVVILGLGMRQAVLMDRINKMTKLGPEFIEAENELRKNAIAISEREVMAEQVKLEITKKRVDELKDNLRIAKLDPNGGARAAKIEEEIQQNIVKLQQQKLELAKRAGEEQVKLANLQATLQQKVNQLKESKEDASKYTIEEFARVGGWGNAANRKAWDKVMEFQRAQEKIDLLRGQGANPEEIQKAIEAREAIRKQLDPRFIKSTDLRSPFQDLEDAIRKLTAEIKAQREVADRWAVPVKVGENVFNPADIDPGSAVKMNATLDEIKKLLSEPLKVKPVNGP